MNAERIWIEGAGFGDAEVYVDGTMTHRLVDTDRSFDSTGERFALVEDRTRRHVGYVTRGDDTAEQIARLLT